MDSSPNWRPEISLTETKELPLHIRVDGSSIKPGHSAGVEAFTYGLVRGLAEATSHDIEVEVLSNTMTEWQRQIPHRGISWSEIPMALRSDTNLGSRLRGVVPEKVRASKLMRHVINGIREHARPTSNDGADATLYPFSCVPIRDETAILVLHDLRRFQPEFRQSGYSQIIRENVAKAAAVAVSWPHPYLQALELFPEARNKTVMIPLPTFHSRPEGQINTPEQGLLLYPSSTAPHKNHATLLAGMAMLPEFRLVCPGPLVEPEATKLLNRAAKPDILGRIEFPGFVTVSDLTDLYRRAWAVVVPSTWEAASGAIFEAFSWGLPVACADVEPLRAQVEFAGAEVAFFKPYEPRSLASAVKCLASNRQHYAEASQKASSKLAERTWLDTAQDYSALFKWAVEGRSGSAPRSPFTGQTP